MEYFDRKFKSISEEGNTNVPENLEWDNVKTGINERLDDANKIHLRSNKKLRNTIFTVLGISLILTLLVFTCRHNEDKVNETENLDWENMASHPDINKSNSKNSDKKLSDSQIALTNVGDNEHTDNESKKTAKNLIGEEIVFQVSNNEKIQNQKSDLEGELTSEKSQNISSNKIHASIPPILNIEALKTINFVLNSTKTNYQNKLPDIINPPLPKQNNSKRFIISAWGGPSIYRGKFSGDEQVEVLRNPNTSFVLGQSYAMTFSTPFSNHCNLMGQLTYSNLYEEFEIEFDKAISILIKDALVKVDSNIITSRKTYYKRDTLVGAVERRHIRHYNNLKLISFGILMEREFPIVERWTVTGSLGFDYTYLIESRGKTIKSDFTIIDFSKDDPIFSKNHLGINLSLGINYHLNDNITIGSNIFMQQYLDNWSMEEGLISRPQVFMLQAGIKYKL